MELIHNNVLQINTGPYAGIHRIILSDISRDLLILYGLDQSDQLVKGHFAVDQSLIQKPKNAQRVPIWLSLSQILELQDQELARTVHIALSGYHLAPLENKAAEALWNKRVLAMDGFLEYENLRHRLLTDQNLGTLIKEARHASNFSKPTLYSLFSVLCHHGFSATALKPQFHKRGSPGKKRPITGTRRKAGAKTTQQKIDLAYGIVSESNQPGMTAEWTKKILAADAMIPSPKPEFPVRIRKIMGSAFVEGYKYVDGLLKPDNLELGSYPNNRQIKYLLNTAYDDLERLKQKTTKHNFTLNHRGLQGYSWEGVFGPGNTYAVDSTIADIYLRSSVNRNWFIGRPVVYVIVDVWSTAVVGFYVCLNGPSWAMAKVAIFCSIANPGMIASIRSLDCRPTLFPFPTMPANFLWDRGEGHSLGSDATSRRLLIPKKSFTPPFRGDLKGVDEVLHDIEKEALQHFVPGAINARRIEYELRKFDPKKAVLTIPEFTAYLESVFMQYNLTSPRDHRLDSHMKSSNVKPTPAGLWKWGHEMGLGVQIAKTESELITELLPSVNVRSTKSGIMFKDLHYRNGTEAEHEAAALARGYGVHTETAHIFPGTVSKLWLPNKAGHGMNEYQLSDFSSASPEISFDEYDDAAAYHKINNDEREHGNLMTTLGLMEERSSIVTQAIALNSVLPVDEGPKVSVREARAADRDAELHVETVLEMQLPQPSTNTDLKLKHANAFDEIFSLQFPKTKP